MGSNERNSKKVLQIIGYRHIEFGAVCSLNQYCSGAAETLRERPRGS